LLVCIREVRSKIFLWKWCMTAFASLPSTANCTWEPQDLIYEITTLQRHRGTHHLSIYLRVDLRDYFVAELRALVSIGGGGVVGGSSPDKCHHILPSRKLCYVYVLVISVTHVGFPGLLFGSDTCGRKVNWKDLKVLFAHAVFTWFREERKVTLRFIIYVSVVYYCKNANVCVFLGGGCSYD
jgi:hypothetical protein